MEVYNHKIAHNTKLEGTKMKNAPKYIKDIATKLEQSQNREEMYKVLDEAVNNTADFICLDGTEFVGNGYKFQCTLKNYVNNMNASNVHLPSGWEFVKVIPIGESDRAVVLTKVK